MLWFLLIVILTCKWFEYSAGAWKLLQPGQAKVSDVAKNVKRTTTKFYSISDYREGAVSASN